MVQLFYTTYISVNVAHHEIFNAKVSKSGINIDIPRSSTNSMQQNDNVAIPKFKSDFPKQRERIQ